MESKKMEKCAKFFIVKLEDGKSPFLVKTINKDSDVAKIISRFVQNENKKIKKNSDLLVIESISDSCAISQTRDYKKTIIVHKDINVAGGK